MYAAIAILSAIVLIYSAMAGRLERTPLSGAILFVSLGLLIGPFGLGLLHVPIDDGGLRLLAELTLAMVLFVEAANSDRAVLERFFQIPKRMLLVGLPLTIGLGFVIGSLIFDGLEALELAILATMLAPTDAALGKAVVTNPQVPPALREGLKLESGLNDGICVPLLLVLLALAGRPSDGSEDLAWLVSEVFVREIGIGALTGCLLSVAASFSVGALVRRKGWFGESWLPAMVPALALLCFSAAQALHGSGLIAAFVGGITLLVLDDSDRHRWLGAAEATGDVLSLLTWVLFGSVVVGEYLPSLSSEAVVYSVLSLTVIRMLPIFLSLWRVPLEIDGRLFVGWFGPRGLASVVFAIIALDADLPAANILTETVVCTVLLSVVAHGVSAVPLARWYASRHSETLKPALDDPSQA